MKTQIKDFLQANVSTEPYSMLRYSIVEVWPKIKIDFDSVPPGLIKKAESDMERFKTIEENRLKIDRPLIGDYILRKDGRITKIGTFLGDKFQDTSGGSFHVSTCGYGSYSGGFTMDVLNTKNLEYTGETKDLLCWTFSGGFSGGNRGVYSHIKVKIWKEL